MSTLGNKTPVSYLQEYLIGLKKVPRYDLIRNGSGTHNPEFTYRVSIDDRWEEGTGRSKREAKHKAAERMLKNLNIVHDSIESEESKQVNTEKGPDGGAFENHVGILNEFCLIHHYPEPKYDLEEAAGPAHSRVFKMVCYVSQLQDYGISKTKKQAKQLAAYKMLEQLKALVKRTESSLPSLKNSEIVQPKIWTKIPEIELDDEEITAKYNALKNISTPATKDREPAVLYNDHHKAFEGLEETSPTLLSLLNETQEVDEEVAFNVLKDIAQELNVNLSFAQIPTKQSNKNLFIMTLTLSPPIAGIGVDKENAAYNLLKTLISFCQ